MSTSDRCPSPKRLEALLREELPPEEQKKLTAHVESCESCLQSLEALASGEEASFDKNERIDFSRASRETALGDLLARLKTRGVGLGTDEPLRDSVDDSLDPASILDPSPNPGTVGRFGPYEILAIIGQGGMGIVLKGVDPSLNRLVAIKVLAPQLATNATARKRFAREAQAAAAVVHDHVVTIHAVDEAKGLPYLVMQFVAGVSLQDRIERDGPLQPPEVLRIGMQTAAGLGAAHAQGLVHRDIKPSNILLENGVERVKITDFGLARAVDDASITRPGVVAGTPEFMAPEQAKGEAVDHRADLFSLGGILYALCTGRPPFRGESSLAVIRKVMDERPRPVREANPDVPEWLAEIVERLLEKDSKDRFQSAEELVGVLGARLARLQGPSSSEGSPGPVPPAARPSRASSPRWSPRMRTAAAAALLSVCFVGLGIAEVTGVTRIAETISTVLRISTPRGTLVLEVDDPDVSVVVEEDGEEIVIEGAGIHSLRLSAGQHRLEATRGGERLIQEVVTITRGDKRVVKVSREHPVAELGSAPPADSAGVPPPSTGVAPSKPAEGEKNSMPPPSTGVAPSKPAEGEKNSMPPPSTGVAPSKPAEGEKNSMPPPSTGVAPSSPSEGGKNVVPSPYREAML